MCNTPLHVNFNLNKNHLVAGADVNGRDCMCNTPLHVNFNLNKNRLVAGADVNGRDCMGNTPLHVTMVALAAQGGAPELGLVSYILTYFLDFNV